jgi:hypothetical protein
MTISFGLCAAGLNKLEALPQPGDALSETIVRLVALEAAARPRRRAAELLPAKGVERSAVRRCDREDFLCGRARCNVADRQFLWRGGAGRVVHFRAGLHLRRLVGTPGRQTHGAKALR